MMELNSKRIVITGASSGLGRAMAEAFHAKGASLLLAARRAAELEALRGMLRGEGPVEVRVLDIAAPSAGATLFAGGWEAPDVLVNNAAVQGPVGMVWDVDWEAWQQCLAVDFVAAVALCRACVPGMIRKGGGKIINLSGGGATGPRPGFSAYAAAKTALVRFSECLAEELKDRNIDVNCVAPGAMPTAMLDGLQDLGPDVVGKREYDTILKVRDKGQAVIEQAVALCAYLASSQSDGITGKLVSAVWDPWSTLQEHIDDLRGSDIYTLRRIVPKDRSKEWGS